MLLTQKTLYVNLKVSARILQSLETSNPSRELVTTLFKSETWDWNVKTVVLKFVIFALKFVFVT